MNIVVIWDQLGQEPLRFFVTQNPRFLAMDRVSSTWKWVGSHAFRPDGIVGDAARYKRVAVLKSAI
jgi:hypothetical protein